MKQEHIDDAARRGALKHALGGGLGAAIAWAIGRPSIAATSVKLAKDAVKYADVGNAPGKDCDDCSQFIAGKTALEPGTCKIVDGSISPHGHCIAFTPKPKP